MTCFRRLLGGLAPLILFQPLLWSRPDGTAAAESESAPGVRVLTHEDILNAGARDLADLLAALPGIRIARDRSRSFPASGPLVSSDTGTQLSAGQMSRVLILFKGHSLNKAWFGGADQDWSTGFLEGLKEIRVYTGPTASYRNGTGGAVDMVVDLIPFEGADQKGAVDLRLSQSLNADRFDKSLFHARGGDRWGGDGQYAWFGDVTRWGGEDVRQAGSDFAKGDRMDRKDSTWQVGGLVQQGDFELMARHLQHEYFDTAFCGRRWGYSLVEGTQALELPDGWRMKVTLGGDHIVSKWGLASSATTQVEANWDQVKESRVSLRVEAGCEVAAGTSIRVSLDARNAWVRGGPDQGPADQSVMNFSVRRGAGGAAVTVLERINPSWSLEGGLRLERVSGFTNIGALPTLSALYREGRTEAGIRYAEGLRYMDLWYRFGSGTFGPGFVPYVAGRELKPERNQQLSLWLKRGLGGPWSLAWNGSIGKYSHLMGFDWDFAEAQGFNQVRAATVGGYRYWDGTGSVRYEAGALAMDASLSYQRSYGARLIPRQLYATPGGEALYLPPLAGSVGVLWKPNRGLVFSGRYHAFSRTRNAGMDPAGGAFNPSYDQGPYGDLPSGSTLDLSLRALELWNRTELQVTVHNALNSHERQPLVEGGYFFSRGRELNLIARRRF